ncbi:MAG: FtsW/RodA/SpoVE family cell cycle protein, partial [Phycisphaerales bacterium]
GTAMLFAPVIFAMLVAAGARLKHLTLVVGICVLAAPAAFPLLKPHQKARIVGLIRMMHDPRQGADDINYQAQTAQRLAGAGGVWGMSDTQSRALIRFNRLPERHNDMVLAVILNRFGLVGGLVVAALYVVWFTGCYLSAAMCKDGFGRLIIVGVATITAAQALVNAGMTLGVLPIIGVTLPFVSYGGSSMLTAWAMTGLVLGVALRRDQRFAKQTFEFDENPYDPARISRAHRGAIGARG